MKKEDLYILCYLMWYTAILVTQFAERVENTDKVSFSAKYQTLVEQMLGNTSVDVCFINVLPV